jgi:hypothetical protein
MPEGFLEEAALQSNPEGCRRVGQGLQRERLVRILHTILGLSRHDPLHLAS